MNPFIQSSIGLKMDSVLHRLQNIHIEPPTKEILSRLKYNVHKTKLDAKAGDILEKTLASAVSICECRGVYRFMEIVEKTDNTVVLAGGTVFESAKLAELLKNSSMVVLMAATVGGEVVSEINSLIKRARASEAVIADAVASEMADAVIDRINLLCADLAKKKGLRLTKRRFSPGYGDFPLENQSNFFNLLELEDMGLKLTDSFMIIPEKSVTAVAGAELYAKN